ncbi:O-antigen ligase family protein, partial [Paraconexibacter sp.]|uniref:O-antigen ligase family protein n=1 Tax=Paraconexibacter sp. TaxID=2949640 RepID=UPI00356AC87C
MAAFVLVLALNGGSYDIVVRQQAGLVVWWLLLLGVVAGVIRGRTLPLDARLVLGGLGVLAVWTAISFGWTSSDERTLTEVARVVAHLGFVVAALLLIGPRTWPAAVAGVAFAMAAVTVLAFAGRFSEGLFGTSAVAVNFGALRLSEPLNYWNALGAWAGMTSALCLAWSAHATRTAVRGLSLAVVPVAIAVSYLTYSRASLGGTVLGIVVVLALSSHRWTLIVHSLAALTGGAAIVLALRGAPELADGVGNDGAAGVLVVAAAAVLVVAVVAAATGRAGLDRRHLGPVAARRFGVALAVCGLLGGAAGAVLVGPDAWRQFKEQGVPATSTDPAARLTNLNGSRYEVWATAVDVFGDHPVKGVGAGTFEYSWNAAQRDDEFLRDAHSLYLEVLAELGIVGFLALL